MPTTATITSTDFWTAGTRETITSSKWNAHMGIWRGHLLPVDGSTSAAANGSYDIGSSDHKWRNIYASGQIFAKPGYAFSTITAALSITAQHVVLCDASTAAYTVTLPAANVSTGTSFIFTKIDSGFNIVTIDANGSEQINDTTTTNVATYGEMLELICDGAKWYKKSRYIDSNRKQFSPATTWSTNIAWDGRMQRLGSDAFICCHGYVSGSLPSASLALTIPFSLAIDYNRLPVGSGGDQGNDRTSVGEMLAIDTGSTFYSGIVTVSTTLTVTPLVSDAASSYVRNSSGLNHNIPMVWANTDALTFWLKVPIVGWEG